MNTNIVVISGRLVRDPEMRYSQNGKAFTKFTMAVNRGGRGENGQNEADFLPVVVWDKQAEACAQYLQKGSQVLISGRITTRNYTTDDGSKRFVTEVIANRVEFVGGAQRPQGAYEGGQQPSAQQPATQQQRPASTGQPARPATPPRTTAAPTAAPVEDYGYIPDDDFPL
jgi:single-strand DNA-binding protein